MQRTASCAVVLILSVSSTAARAALSVSTFAGSSTGGGYREGTGTAARFSAPKGVAVCNSGDIYVADTGNNAIRLVRGGVVTTVSAATGLKEPRGLVADADCNLYIADTGNNAIRSVSHDAHFTTVIAIGLNAPRDVAIGADGALYVADTGNHVIRRVTLAGDSTVFAGKSGTAGSADGASANARFNLPNSIAADAEGNLYTGDSENHSIRRITPSGVVTTITQTAGEASVAWANGHLYWTEREKQTVQRLAATAETVAGSAFKRGFADGSGDAVRFLELTAIAPAPDGTLVVVEAGNHTLRRVAEDGRVDIIAGSAPLYGHDDGVGAAAGFTSPVGLTFAPDGTMYVGEFGAVRKISPDARVTLLAGNGELGTVDGIGTSARFSMTGDLAADRFGNVYLTEFFAHVVRKIAADGTVTTIGGKLNESGFVDGRPGTSRFRNPRGVAVDADGNLYIADAGNGALRKMTPAGDVTTIDRSLGAPMNLVFDADGNLYYVQEGPLTLTRRRPSGEKTTLGTLTSPLDGEPRIARAPDGTFYAVAARTNAAAPTSSIWQITSGGQIVRVAGRDYGPGNENGSATIARFDVPSMIAFAPDGRLYVADTGNHSIRVLAFADPVVISTFTASPAVVAAGDRVTLRWTTSGGSSAEIDQGVGPVSLNGSVIVTAVNTTLYTLTVRGDGGTANAVTSVVVGGARHRAVAH